MVLALLIFEPQPALIYQLGQNNSQSIPTLCILSHSHHTDCGRDPEVYLISQPLDFRRVGARGFPEDVVKVGVLVLPATDQLADLQPHFPRKLPLVVQEQCHDLMQVILYRVVQRLGPHQLQKEPHSVVRGAVGHECHHDEGDETEVAPMIGNSQLLVSIEFELDEFQQMQLLREQETQGGVMDDIELLFALLFLLGPVDSLDQLVLVDGWDAIIDDHPPGGN